MKDELLDRITSEGEILNETLKRSDFHERGLWHRAISIFVLNPLGEILLERRSEHKDLFPGYYDVVGGHVKAGEKPLQTAKDEIFEELSLEIDIERINAICKDDELIENVVLPEKNLINLERKTIYLLEITQEEEFKIIENSNRWANLSEEQLKEKGAFGEVSHIEFWSWEKLLISLASQGDSKLASGTSSSLADAKIYKIISEKCIEIRKKCRKDFAGKFRHFEKAEELNEDVDKWLYELFKPNIKNKANVYQTYEIFRDGHNQIAGAYKMDDFRRLISHDSFWEEKYKDPSHTYVTNLIMAMSFKQPNNIKAYLSYSEPDIIKFVSRLLELPMTNGERFRDPFGNLVDIAVARNAVLVWLKNNPNLLPKTILQYPNRKITKYCIEGSLRLYEKHSKLLPNTGYPRLLHLVQLGIAASSLDFNNPNFQRKFKELGPSSDLVSLLFDDIKFQKLAEGIGGDYFLRDFYKNYIENSISKRIVYFPGSAAQSVISFAIAVEILRQNKNASIAFIPKSGFPGNDLSYDDSIKLLKSLSKQTFNELINYQANRRFVILKNGPFSHGLDPDGLDEYIARTIVNSDVIFAEGQAYAEIRGWKKDAYIAFRINGRVATAIHGETLKGEGGFIKLQPGIDHYQFNSNSVKFKNRKISLVSQNSSEYVKAILDENFEFIVKDIFRGNMAKAIEQVQKEAINSKKTFSQVVLGTTAKLPTRSEISEFRDRKFSVFACGGGGGFSSVTINALQQLNFSTVAGVPSTDDGGSTGVLQSELKDSRGFVFGVGDMASILQESILNKGKKIFLSYRFPKKTSHMVVKAVKKRIKEDLTSSTSELATANDYLSFICDQLNLARIIDQKIQSNPESKISIKGTSIRNLNIIAAFELCGALGDSSKIDEDDRIAALIVLQKALGISSNIIALPVTYDACKLYLDYGKQIPNHLLDNKVPEDSHEKSNNRIYGQQYIDKLPHDGRRVMVGVRGQSIGKPRASEEYLRRLREAEFFIMGAGSLISSQLAQLVIPGVIDELINAKNKRRILVLNHVKMDETIGMTVKDHIILIEDVAENLCSEETKRKLNNDSSKIRIGDLFSDIVIPQTVASELEKEISALKYVWKKPKNRKFTRQGYYKNKYVDFIEKYPAIRDKYKITEREIEILSFLEQPAELYSHRTEKGRYRGALYATKEDIKYLLKQGIQKRNIYQVDSIGKNLKIIKKEGPIEVEHFPGIIPQALMGIFKIVQERAVIP